MQKVELARKLRERQIALGNVAPAIITALSDEDIIDCYVTCSCCGIKSAEGSDLEYAITTAKNTDHFFQIVDRIGAVKHQIGPDKP